MEETDIYQNCYEIGNFAIEGSTYRFNLIKYPEGKPTLETTIEALSIFELINGKRKLINPSLGEIFMLDVEGKTLTYDQSANSIKQQAEATDFLE